MLREEIVALGLLIVALAVTGIPLYLLISIFHLNFDTLDLTGFLLILGIVLTISGFVLPGNRRARKRTEISGG